MAYVVHNECQAAMADGLRSLPLWDSDAIWRLQLFCMQSALRQMGEVLCFALWCSLLCSLLVRLVTTDWLMTCRPAIRVCKGPTVVYGQQKEVGTPSVWLPICLDVEHLVNFEVNL